MAYEQLIKESSRYDAYFARIQSRKKLPRSLQETLTTAFANIPVSSFPQVPGGKGESNKTSALKVLAVIGSMYSAD